jgi:hypothetical protein
MVGLELRVHTNKSAEYCIPTREKRFKIQNTKVREKKNEGEKRSPPTLFSPVHRFLLLFCVKVL